MKTTKQLAKHLNKMIGNQWKSDCAESVGVSRQTVSNTIKGTHHNLNVKLWINNKIEEIEHLFI